MENRSMEEIKKLLQAPFDPKDIEWRISRTTKKNGKQWGWVLAYITARAIQDRLDGVFGPGGWQNEFVDFRDGIVCKLSCFINGQWITKEDGAPLTEIESLKGGLSNALKRVGSQFGIGRYLYGLPETMVEIKPDRIQGANYCNDKKNGVVGYWLDPKLPTWALPDGDTSNTRQSTSQQGSASSGQKKTQQGTSATNQEHNAKKEQQSKQRDTQSPTNENPREKAERQKVVMKIQEYLENTGLTQHKGYIMPLFKRINPDIQQVSETEVFETASYQELVKYYEVLRPVSDLKVIADHYKISLEQVMAYCRILIPSHTFERFSECFQVVTSEHVKQIIEMIKGDIDNGVLQTA